MSRRALTEEMKAEAFRLYKNRSLTVKEIANITNIGYGTLIGLYSRAFKDGTLKYRQPEKQDNSSRFTEEDLRQISVDYYEKGLTVKQLEEKYNIKQKQIQRMRRIFGGSYEKKYLTKKAVEQYDLEGNKIAEYDSLAEAQRKTGVNTGTITMCCRGEKYYKTAGGFVWKYKEK